MQAVWRNGSFVAAEAAIDASDRGLLLGDGVFDTALVGGGRVFRQADHLDRLLAALDQLAIPAERAQIEAAMEALAGRQGNGSIRLTVTRGPGPRGLKLPADPRPTVLGSSAPLAPAAMFAPARLSIASTRRNETSPLSRLKSLSYLDAVLAQREATASGAEEALFLNTQGRIASSALANILLLQGTRILTPPVSDGVLPGIMRKWVLENAERFGLEATERSLLPDELADGTALLANSLRLISPARLADAPAADLPSAARRLMDGLCRAIAAECGTDPREFGAALPTPVQGV